MADIPEDELVALRHVLHASPELSSQETRTAETVARWFARLSPDGAIERLGGHGVAFIFEGDAAGPTVLLRCELDALPIDEATDLSYRSRTPDVSHKCGHDGHMAILAGVGCTLASRRPRRGRVVLLYQPAEETGVGASAVLADPRFERIAPDHVFALHNLPTFPRGTIVVRRGTFSCASVGMVVDLVGRTSHAAYPQFGLNPMECVNDVAAGVTALPASEGFATITHVSLGEPNLGIAPGHARVMVSLRADRDEGLEALKSRASELVAARADAHGLGCAVQWREMFRAGVSDPAAHGRVAAAATALGVDVHELSEPMRWSEDFSEFTARFPGAMFGLGSGEEQPQLHHPDFDFPDEIILPGARVFRAIVDGILD